MKNIRKFETTAKMNSSKIEDVSVHFDCETGILYTLPPRKIYAPKKAKAGDGVFYNVRSGNYEIVGQSKFESVYDAEFYKPIGVVVVPSAHDVYGTGECGVISITTPADFVEAPYYDGGWGIKDVYISQKDYSKIPVKTGGFGDYAEFDKLTMVTSEANLPTNYNPNNRDVVINEDDTDTFYLSMYLRGVSPYLTNDNRNSEYYSEIEGASSLNPLGNFDGFNDTQNILTVRGERENSWVPDPLNNEDYFPASYCERFVSASDEEYGKWYLPSLGEAAYSISKANEIISSINKLRNLCGYNDEHITLPHGFFTSTEAGGNAIYAVDINQAMIDTTYIEGGYTPTVLPFIRIKPNLVEVDNNTNKNYMRFVAVEDSVIKLNAVDYNTLEYVEPTVNLMVNKNNEGWTEYDFTPISLVAGETLYLKGDNPNGFSVVDFENWTGVFYSFGGMNEDGNGSTGKFECHGNIMSLLYGDDFEDKTTIPSVGCFFDLFFLCEGLLTAPKLPATTLESDCYASMFDSCTSLIESPILPATELEPFCYFHMFWGCTNLSKITMLATDITAQECLTMWTGMIDNETDEEVSGVAPTGVFVKNIDMGNLPIGNQENRFSGIPEGWVVEDYILINECTSLTITADDVDANQTSTKIYYTAIGNYRDENGTLVEENITVTGQTFSAPFPKNDSYTEDVIREISFTYLGVTATTTITQHAKVPYHEQYLTLVVSKDAYVKFINTVAPKSLMEEISMPYEYSYDGISWIPYDDSEIHLVSGQQILWKGYYEKWSGNKGFVVYEKDEYGYESNGVDFIAYGNVMSLLYGDEFYGKTEIPEGCGLGGLFRGSRLIDASNLILPATTLANYCYEGMFSGCANLTTAPKLPATTLTEYCYEYMFKGCTNLTVAPELPATTLANNCYEYMFAYCENLTTAPELPATTLANYCYISMFEGCTSLNRITMLATDISASYCLNYWVGGVSSTGTFVKHPNMYSLPSGVDGIPEGWTVEDAVL